MGLQKVREREIGKDSTEEVGIAEKELIYFFLNFDFYVISWKMSSLYLFPNFRGELGVS